MRRHCCCLLAAHAVCKCVTSMLFEFASGYFICLNRHLLCNVLCGCDCIYFLLFSPMQGQSPANHRVKNKQTRKNSVILSNEVFSTITLQCISLTDSTGQSISCALFSFWCALYFDKYVSLLALHRVSCLSQSVNPYCHSCFVFFIYPCLFYFLFFVPKHGRIFIWHFQLFIQFIKIQKRMCNCIIVIHAEPFD